MSDRSSGPGGPGAHDQPAWARRLEALDAELSSLGADVGPERRGRQGGGLGDGFGDGLGRDDRRDDRRDALGDGFGGDDRRGDDGDEIDGFGRDDRRDDRRGDDGDEDGDGEHDDDATRRRRAIIDWVVVIGVALFVAFLVRTFVLAHFVVDGVSMTPTLHDEDRVFVNKLSYRLHDPNRGDVVVLHQLNGTSERDLIKRVIALPGEEIEIENCEVTIDGDRLEEPYLDPEAQLPGTCGRDYGPETIPTDHVFVMGDNRGGSMDSRDLGPISEDDLVGRAFVVFWPTSNWQWL